MRELMKLVENVDDYSTKGHAGMPVRRNDPRFGDNPMVTPEESPEELDEFEDTTASGIAKLDKLHDMLRRAEITDREIKLGVQLSDQGLHKVAAAFGTHPDEIKMLMAALRSQLSDQQDDDGEITLQEQYRRFMMEDDSDVEASDPDHVSAEGDILGNITVRSSKSGRERYFQGSQAAGLADKLANTSGRKREAMLKPLAEDDVMNEINTDGGSYNFPWKLDGQTGFGTVQYSLIGGKPQMKLISVRDSSGEDVDMDDHMRQELEQQAYDFIPDA